MNLDKAERLNRGRNRYGSRYTRKEGRLTCGELRMIMRCYNLTASQIARIIGRPKNTVMAWVRNEGPTDPGFPIPLTCADALKLISR